MSNSFRLMSTTTLKNKMHLPKSSWRENSRQTQNFIGP